MAAIVLYTQACPGLELKILPRFYPLDCGVVGTLHSLYMSMVPISPRSIILYRGLMGLFNTLKVRSNNSVDFTTADYHQCTVCPWLKQISVIGSSLSARSAKPSQCFV
jgi:hypothetical protein